MYWSKSKYKWNLKRTQFCEACSDLSVLGHLRLSTKLELKRNTCPWPWPRCYFTNRLLSISPENCKSTKCTNKCCWPFCNKTAPRANPRCLSKECIKMWKLPCYARPENSAQSNKVSLLHLLHYIASADTISNAKDQGHSEYAIFRHQ